MSAASVTSTSENGVAPFRTVPVELTHQIFAHLIPLKPPNFRIFQDEVDFKDGLASIAHFGQTCWKHCDIAAPILAKLQREYPEERDRQYHLQPRAYARTILSNPLLAAREIGLRVPSPSILANSCWDKFNYSKRFRWLSTILVNLPNLKSLRLPVDFDLGRYRMNAVVDPPLRPGSLPCLETVVLHIHPALGFGVSGDLHDFADLFIAAPNIKRLEINCCLCPASRWVPLRLGNLEALQISNVGIPDLNDLKRIIVTCPRLRTLRLKGIHWPEGPSWKTQIRQFIARLAIPSARTLEIL